jgi:hypothetical protein
MDSHLRLESQLATLSESVHLTISKTMEALHRGGDRVNIASGLGV